MAVELSGSDADETSIADDPPVRSRLTLDGRMTVTDASTRLPCPQNTSCAVLFGSEVQRLWWIAACHRTNK